MLFGLQAAGSSFAAEESTQPAAVQTEMANPDSDVQGEEQQEKQDAEAAENGNKETQEEPDQPVKKTAKAKTAETKAVSKLDLADGDIYLAEKTITQGNSSFNHKNTITVTGTGSTVTAEGYSGTIILKDAKVKKSLKIT